MYGAPHVTPYPNKPPNIKCKALYRKTHPCMLRINSKQLSKIKYTLQIQTDKFTAASVGFSMFVRLDIHILLTLFNLHRMS